MIGNLPVFSVILLISACCALGSALYGLRQRRNVHYGMQYALVMFGITAWSLACAVQAAVPDAGTEILFAKFEYLAVAAVPPLWFIFSLSYSRVIDKVPRPFLVALWVVPAVTVVMAATNEWHHLLWSSIVVSTKSSPFVNRDPLLIYNRGPWYWVNIGYNYIWMTAGTVLFLRAVMKFGLLYRYQGYLVILGALFPWLGNFMYILGLQPLPGLDLTPVGFTMSGALSALGIFQFKFMNIVPVARDVLVENMTDGVLVLDTDRRIVDFNPAFSRLCGDRGGIRIGQHAGEALKHAPELLECFEAAADCQITAMPGPEPRHFDIRISALNSRSGSHSGSLIIMRDITDHRRALESRELFSLAVAQSPVSVVITDADGNIEYVNPEFSKLTKYSIDEVLGKNPRILKSGLKPAEEYRDLWMTIKGGNTWRGEFHNKNRDGDLFWESASISPIVDQSGRIRHYVAVKEDITTQKLALEALLTSERALKQRNDIIENDLEQAQIIQKSLLPSDAPEVPRLRVSHRYIPLDAIGGDFFSYTLMQEGGFGLFIGDVSGHGVSAALYTALLKATGDRLMRKYGDSPREFITRMNAELIASMFRSFVTGIYGCFKTPGSGAVTFTFANAGHPHPVLRTENGALDFIQARGTLMGNFPNAAYEEKTFSLKTGERLYFYTDGIPETFGPGREMIGFDSLLELFRKAERESLEDTLDEIIKEVNLFRGDAAVDDDVLIVGVEVC